MKYVFFLIAFCLSTLYAVKLHAVSPPVWEWVKTNGTQINDFTFRDNNIYTIGEHLIKWDTSGNIIWDRPFAGNHIKIDNNNEIIVVATMTVPQIVLGAFNLINNGLNDILLMKLDTTGSIIWANNYGNSGYDYASELSLDFENNIFLNSKLNSISGISKFSTSGTHLWTKAFEHCNCGAIGNSDWLHIFYSNSDSTIVFAGAYSGSLTFGNITINASYDPVYGIQNDIFAGKMRTDSTIVFLQNFFSTPRANYDNNSIYVNSQSGNIFLNCGFFSLSGNNNGVYRLSSNGVYNQTLHSFNNGYVLPNGITHIISGGDSLVGFQIKDGAYLPGNEEYNIYNSITGSLLHSYAFNPSYPALFGNGNVYFISNDKYFLRKLGDPSYVPMTIHDFADTVVCSDVDFNTNGWINSGYPPYNISWWPTTGLSNPNLLNPGFNLDSTSTYIVTVTDSANVSLSDTITLIVNKTPQDSITILGSAIFCYGSNDSVQLTCNLPGLQNSWTSNNLGIVATDTNLIWGKSNSIYTLTTTELLTGCFSKSILDLHWYPAYPAIISNASNVNYNDTIVKCFASDSIVLKNRYSTFIAASNIKWFKDGLLIDSNKQSIKTNLSGEYVLRIQDNYCEQSDTIRVIYSSPNVIAHASLNSVCLHDTLILYGSGANSYVWSNGITDSLPFVVTQALTYSVVGNSFGCLDTAIISTSILPSYFTTNTAYICHGGTYTFVDNYVMQNITTAGVSHTSKFNMVNGCDSSIKTTIYLYPIPNTVTYEDICHGSNYTFADGTIYYFVTFDTLHSFTTYDIDGCTLLNTTRLHVLNKSAAYKNDTICQGESYTFPDGQTILNVTDDLTDTFKVSIAPDCDSTIYTTLHIKKLDTSVSSFRTHLLANATNKEYEWFDCNTDIALAGENSSQLYPAKSGYYYATIRGNGCTAKTRCSYIDIPIEQEFYCTVYPNPVVSSLIIEYNDKNDGFFTLYNYVGETVLRIALPKGKSRLTHKIEGLPFGIYFYNVSFKNKESYIGKLSVIAR